MGAEIPDGAVLVARAILNSSLWTMRPVDRIVALTCMAICNKRPRKWFDGERQIIIERGQFVRSRAEMARACNLPIQVVRTSLVHLEENGFLTRNPTKRYTVYTVPKYQHYQDLTKYSDSVVEKSTRLLTQHQPGGTPKSNQAKKRTGERKSNGSQEVAPLLKDCGNFLTKQNLKTNPKQQQQAPHSSPISRSLRTETARTGDGEGVAVVVPEGTAEDEFLNKVSFRISSKLLVDIGMSQACANSFAAQKTLGQVLRAVEQAHGQKRPGGWARVALENDWLLPRPGEAVIREVVEMVKADIERANVKMSVGVMSGRGNRAFTARQPGETEEQWFRRVNDQLKKHKEPPRKSPE